MHTRARIVRLALVALMVAAALPLGALPAQAQYVFGPGTPVYRFYNQSNGSHFYTSSSAEYGLVNELYPNLYTYEGVAYYTPGTEESSAEGASIIIGPPNTTPLYRFYNKANGGHFYTISEDEKAFIEANLSATFAYEGVAYLVFDMSADGMMVPVHRFYNVLNGSHFYTASEWESALVKLKFPEVYRYEGVAFFVWGMQPRFYKGVPD